jgi:DNA (cytosine-5)-methyltransferase 1
MRYFDSFSGVGGFSLGIHRAIPDAECVGFSEIDSHASAVLKYHYPNVRNYGSITDIQWSEVPDFDLLVGGSPCQDFSIAGKRAGLVGARSGLAYEYIRALEEKRPAHFIWENVRGVLSSNRGWDFAAILNQMAEAGYSLQWQVLNAKHFGVPQNRERVFVIGTRTDLGSAGEVFFERQGDGTHHEPSSDVREQASNTLRTNYSSGFSNETYVGTPVAFNRNEGVKREIETAGTLSSSDWRGLNRNQDQNSVWNGYKVRRLMPVECERLMSWPDGHTSRGRKEDGTEYEVSDTQRYKMCGNGVVSEVVKNLVEQLYETAQTRYNGVIN